MSGPIDSDTAHHIGCLSSFLVSIPFGSSTCCCVVSLLVTARSAVVPGVGTIGIGISRGASTELRNELRVGQKCHDQLLVDKGKFFGQGAVGGGDHRNGLTIMQGDSS